MGAVHPLLEPLAVVLLAASPVAELRGSIPLGLAFGMPVAATLALSILGNSLPPLAIYGFGNAWLRFIEKRKGFWQRFTERVMGRAKAKLNGKYLAWGLPALAIFVAIPLPLTGAWTGALAAFAFGIPFRRAYPYIMAGVLCAGIIVTLAAPGAVAASRVFLD
jgi:uncharacterized membrane protein